MKQFYILALLFSFEIGQAQPKVNIEMTRNVSNPRLLEISIRPNQNLSDYISAVVFTIRWAKSCGSVTLGNPTTTFNSLPMTKSGSQHADATYNYQIFACTGTAPVLSYTSNTPTLIMTMPVEGAGSTPTCVFEIVASHQDPTFGDGNFYIEFSTDGGVNNFAGTITNNANVLLPVELIDFKATKKDNAVQLAWQTASEQNAHHFDIERSNDGLSFFKIGEQKALGSKETTAYTAFDNTPPYGINYYRLKIVDLDGKVDFSKTQSLTFGKGLIVRTFPNPMDDELTVDISTEAKTVNISIADMLGRVVFRQNTEGGSFLKIKTTDWQKGVFIMTLGDGQKTFQQKIVKQ